MSEINATPKRGLLNLLTNSPPKISKVKQFETKKNGNFNKIILRKQH